MTITLNPQTEERLRALAGQQNLSIEAVLERMVEQEASNQAASPAQVKRARTLVELFADSPLKGSGIVIERDRSLVRDITL